MTVELPAWAVGLGIPETVALASVALIGYLFGRRTRQQPPPDRAEEIERAAAIAHQLESIAGALRGDLALHRTRVERFKKQLRSAASREDARALGRLRAEAEAMLGPTLRLAGQLSTAYDKIRQQSHALANYTGGRIDPMTGLCNARSLEEQLDVALGGQGEGPPVCSVAVLSIEGGGGDANATPDQLLQKAARALNRQLRGSDFAARYGIGELVVVMPKTPLSGASVFGRRLRATMDVALGLQISCGVAEALPGDTAKVLLARADSALYSARATQPGSQYVHTGASIRPDRTAEADEEAPAESPRAAESTAAPRA